MSAVSNIWIDTNGLCNIYATKIIDMGCDHFLSKRALLFFFFFFPHFTVQQSSRGDNKIEIVKD